MKRKFTHIFAVLLLFLTTTFFFLPSSKAIIIFTNEFLSNEGEIAVIDSDGNATGSITLKFGQTANQTLVWDITNSRFVLSNNFIVNGTFGINGNTFTLDADNTGTATTVNIVAEQGTSNDGTLRYNASTQQWEISNNGGAFNAIATGGGAANAFVQNGNSFGTTATLGTNDNNILAFEVNNSERMRINTAGDVGIGATTIPANKKLTVSNTAAPTFNAAGNGMGVSMSGGGGIYMKNSTDNVEGKFESYGSAIQVGVSGTVQAPLLLSYDSGFPGARLDTNGHFAIGQTTAGSYRLDVQNSGVGMLSVARLQNNQAATINNGSEMIFSANRTTGGMTTIGALGSIITDISNGAYKGALVFKTANNAAPAERMRIDHNGNVSITGNTTSVGFTSSANIDFGLNQATQMRQENLTSAPTCNAAASGRVYFNTTDTTSYICDGTSWTASNPGASNYVFAYDTNTQAVSTANTFKNVTFSNNGQLNGWTHTANTANFTCTQSGLYMATIVAQMTKTGGGTTTASFISSINGSEIPGSQGNTGLTTNNLALNLSQNFLFSATAGQVLNVAFTGGTTNVRILPGGNGTTKPSITLTIVRIN